jgi:uncharacterized protein YchJ
VGKPAPVVDVTSTIFDQDSLGNPLQLQSDDRNADLTFTGQPWGGDIENLQSESSENASLASNSEPHKHQSQVLTVTNQNNIGRNDPCPCGSGKKYKKCCYPKFG